MTTDDDVTEEWITEQLARLPRPSDPDSQPEMLILLPYRPKRWITDPPELDSIDSPTRTIRARKRRMKNLDTGTVCSVWECRGVVWPPV